jgi:carboxypeptidase family protein
MLGQGNTEGSGSGPNPSSEETPRIGANMSLSRLQTFVSLAAGIVSIAGALVAIPNFFQPAHGKGELVAIVQDAKTEKAVSGATIEVLTPQGVLVTTLTPNSSGKASCTLDEGHFRVRVSHPGFGNEVREVQVVSRESTQVRVQLRASASLPRTIRRLFGR